MHAAVITALVVIGYLAGTAVVMTVWATWWPPEDRGDRFTIQLVSPFWPGLLFPAAAVIAALVIGTAVQRVLERAGVLGRNDDHR